MREKGKKENSREFKVSEKVTLNSGSVSGGNSKRKSQRAGRSALYSRKSQEVSMDTAD
jgi:hypothetical protein